VQFRQPAAGCGWRWLWRSRRRPEEECQLPGCKLKAGRVWPTPLASGSACCPGSRRHPKNAANDPLVHRVIAGIVREHGISSGRKLPIRVRHLRLIVAQIPSNPIGTRDKALLLVGFAGVFRRSELVGIDRQHLQFVPEGIKVFIWTVGIREDQTVGIPYGKQSATCPAHALRAWLELLPAGEGPVFRRTLHRPVSVASFISLKKSLLFASRLDGAGRDICCLKGSRESLKKKRRTWR